MVAAHCVDMTPDGKEKRTEDAGRGAEREACVASFAAAIRHATAMTRGMACE
jgi:hypothetical protein